MAGGVRRLDRVRCRLHVSTMSGDHLGDLVEACRAAPGSDAILRAMLRAARETATPEDAIAYLTAADPALLDSETTRRSAGDFLTTLGENEASLAWFQGDEPDTLLRRARALLALGRMSEAADSYQGAVRVNPDLRNPEMDRAVGIRLAADGSGADIISLAGRRGDAVRPADGESLPPPERDRVTFADIGGLADVKDQIRRKIILPFRKPSLFQRFRRKAGGGILLFGPPGCGKTMLARATAGECEASFSAIRIPEILDMYMGESEKKLAAAFAAARADAPAVLFFDEIEAIAARRRFDANSTQASLVSTFLSELDGAGVDNAGVLVLAATNVPWAIDTAFRRPGRFDRVIFVPPPDREARKEILKSHLRERPQSPDLNLEPIAAATSGYSGADLAGLVEAATDMAIDDSLASETGLAPIIQQHLAKAVREQKATTTEWLTTARNYAKYANEGGLYDDVVEFLEKHAR